MQEAVAELAEKVRNLTEVVEGLKIIQQRSNVRLVHSESKTHGGMYSDAIERLNIIQQRSEVRPIRSESKTHGGMNSNTVESLQDQMDMRFNGVHTRMDDIDQEVANNTELLNEILLILRGNTSRMSQNPNAAEPDEE